MRSSPGTVAAWWIVLGVFTAEIFASETVKVQNALEAQAPLDDNAGQQQPLSSSIEMHEHQTLVPLEQISGEANTPRHLEAKSRLREELARNHGTWNVHHPRHRLLDALWGFLRYQERQRVELERVKKLYKNVSKGQKALLEKHVHYSAKFVHIDQALAENQKLCDRIVQNALEFYDVKKDELQEHIDAVEKEGKKADKTSVSQALKHFVRDWAEAGLNERRGPFSCILDTLNRLFLPQEPAASEPIKILLPGAGLGRLGHEVAKRGDFEVTINEWSMYMNVAYRFLEANRARNTESFRPFVDGWSHHATEADMHRELLFPDAGVNASSVILVEGDFTTAFNDKSGEYDVVLTYFFIDTARNLMSYFDAIRKVLKPGGYWINLGPLLYGTGPFVQLALEEIVIVTEAMGFRYLDTDEKCGEITLPGRKVRGREAIYGFDERALTKSAYAGQFWVAQKV